MAFRDWTLSRRITLFSVAFLVLAVLQSLVILGGILSINQLVQTIYEQRFQSSRMILEDTVSITRTNMAIVQLVQKVVTSTEYGPHFEENRQTLLGDSHRLVAQPATGVISPTIEVNKSNLDPVNARTGALVGQVKDKVGEIQDLMDEVFEPAWQEMKRNLAAADLLVLAEMPRDLEHSHPLERWDWFRQCPGLMGARQVAGKCVSREFDKANFRKRYAALQAEVKALGEEAV